MSVSISRVNILPVNVSQLSPGSRAILPNGKEYILNNSKNWIPIHMFALEVKTNLISENLNDIVTLGIYHQQGNVNATLPRNYPTESAGNLRVYVFDDNIFQEYQVLSGQLNEDKIYTRGKYMGIWSGWKVPNYTNITQSEWNTILTNSHTHTNKTLLDSYNQTNVDITDAVVKKHVHTNLSTLNNISPQHFLNWDSAFSWDNHASAGYLNLSTADSRYVNILGDETIDGSLRIINLLEEDTSFFVSGVSYASINFNTINVSGFGLYSKLTNGTNVKFSLGKQGMDVNQPVINFLEYDDIVQKWTIGKDVPIYVNILNLGTVNATKTLTIDNAGKIGYVEGLPITSFTETDPTVPSYVKTISTVNISNWNLASLNSITYIDDRIIEPNSISQTKLKFGFSSWNNNNVGPYADFLHFGGYPDGSGGLQNLILFNKTSFGIRQYQDVLQSTTPYSNYVDFWHTGNFTQTNINNWNTAFDWDNHALAGYLKTVITSPQNSDILQYDGTNWVNKNVSNIYPNKHISTFLVATWTLINSKYQLTINHTLNTENVVVTLYETTSGIEKVEPEKIVIVNSSTVYIIIAGEPTLRFNGKIIIT